MKYSQSQVCDNSECDGCQDGAGRYSFCFQIHSMQLLKKPSFSFFLPVSSNAQFRSWRSQSQWIHGTKEKWMTRRNFYIGFEIRCDLCLLRICQSKLAILTQKQDFLLIHFMRNVRGHKNKRWNFLKLFREDILVLLKFKITPLSFQTLAFHVICSREVYC